MTTDHTNSKTPEAPPLPDGWTKESYHGSTAYRGPGPGSDHNFVDIYHDGKVVLIDGPTIIQAKALHAVLTHHLALVATGAVKEDNDGDA